MNNPLFYTKLSVVVWNPAYRRLIERMQMLHQYSI